MKTLSICSMVPRGSSLHAVGSAFTYCHHCRTGIGRKTTHDLQNSWHWTIACRCVYLQNNVICWSFKTIHVFTRFSTDNLLGFKWNLIKLLDVAATFSILTLVLYAFKSGYATNTTGFDLGWSYKMAWSVCLFAMISGIIGLTDGTESETTKMWVLPPRTMPNKTFR